MPQSDDPDDPVLRRRALAGEIALRLMPDAQASHALHEDAGLSDEVAAWEDRLAQMAEGLAPLPPSAAVWERIAAATKAVPARMSWSAKLARLFAALAFWQAMTAASLAAALAFGVVLVRVLSAQPSGAPAQIRVLVAPLSPRAGPSLYVAAFDPSRNSIRLIATGAESPDAPAGERILWLSPKDDGEPIRIGTVPAGNDALVPVRVDLVPLAMNGAGLVVTVQPEPGADAPGVVIAHGIFTPL